MDKELMGFIAEWPGNQFFNLAFEEAFYRNSAEPRIRFWRNDKVVVIGRLQSPVLEVNALECRKLGVKLVRRFTGGGAVYHDLGNINYAVALPGYNMDLADAFRTVAEGVVSALKELGVEGAYYKPLNDIEVEGLKISGLAASRSSNGVFVHGAMLVSSDLEILWRVLKISREKLVDKKLTQSRVKRVITLREVLGSDIGAEELYEAIGNSIAKRLGLEFKWANISRGDMDLSLELYRKRYSKAEWNLAFTEDLRDLITAEEYEALLEIGRPDPEQEELLKEAILP